MKMINEQEIFETWTPVIESKTSIKDSYKTEWLSKYCHYHTLNENMDGYATLGGFASTQGAPTAPSRGGLGSGDKFPSLLPLAIQVAAKTVGFDIVPVIPMSGPTGVLTYLDYVYAGGNINKNGGKPEVINVEVVETGGLTVGAAYTIGTIEVSYVGKSRINGYAVFKITTVPSNTTIAAQFAIDEDIIGAGAVVAGTIAGAPALVSALENHIAGFAGSANNTWNTTGAAPMKREAGEESYYNMMNLKTFTKFVEADTYQAGANVTLEQIQDLNKQFGIDIVKMIENSLVNEVSQNINKHILSEGFRLGTLNHTKFAATEGSSMDLNLNAAVITGALENLQTLQRRIFSRVLAAGNIVANRGRRGPSNFIVTNAQVATAIQDIGQFVAAPFANTANQNVGALYPVGTLAGMTVYVDQNMSWDDTRVLVGRKGADDEPGLKFMPYMMAESIQTISEGTMSPKIVVKSRYSLVEAGFHPETMYFTFTITTPSGGLV
jgi:hypothetical protein